MGFLHPELLLLLLPLGWWWWKVRHGRLVVQGLRVSGAVALCLALCGPYLKTSSTGRDLILVMDRSRSMPAEAEASFREWIQAAESDRRDQDRIGVVTFGARPAIERLPSTSARFTEFERTIDADGSDLGLALETALELIPEDRAGSVVVISDGEAQGSDPVALARRAFHRGVHIDVHPFPRPARQDLSVERLDLPEEVGEGEPFQFTVWVRADQRVESDFTLRRGAQVLSAGRRVFEKGLNRLVFRDVVHQNGTADYHVELAADEDRIPENNRGLGATRVRGTRRLLVLNHDGAADVLVQSLRAAGIPTDVSTPEAARLDAVGLSAWRGVILENVAASRLGEGRTALRDLVTERGGGLLLTGGPASFGNGGYFRSDLDPVLPVSTEMRQEHRKLGIALAITMDRSGSMSMPVAGGQTKMDLANLGASAAIELLSPMDAVSVIAVDSAPHVVQALTPVEDKGALIGKVRRIESMGGGIFTYTALLAAGRQLEDAPQKNRHIILFADADDSEEQENCPELLQQFESLGITVSVIALGTPASSDAEFLRDVARLGHGEVYFTTSSVDLPRLFALDTMKAARATFVEEPTTVQALADLFAMGDQTPTDFPTLGGYNLTYLREGAMAGAVTLDEYQAPVFAFWYHGLGRTAAFTGQVGGQYGGAVASWEGFHPFFGTLGRWLLGQEEPEAFFPTVQRDGRNAVVAVEVDAEREVPPDTSSLEARLLDGERGWVTLPLERVSETRFEARFPLQRTGIKLGTVRVGDQRVVELPPIALPYSPEFERSPDADQGSRLLRRLAQESGGLVSPTMDDLLRGERRGRATRLVTREFLWFGLLLLLMEIAVRRLQLTLSLPGMRWASARASRLLRRLPRAGPRPRRAAAGTRATPGKEPPEDPAPPPGPTAEDKTADLDDALARAKKSAGRRLGR